MDGTAADDDPLPLGGNRPDKTGPPSPEDCPPSPPPGWDSPELPAEWGEAPKPAPRPAPDGPRRRPSRLTVVEQVYFQEEDGQPVRYAARHSVGVKSDDQPYGPRRFPATAEWQPLDLGWLSGKPCVLLIRNEEGFFSQANPSRDEREASARRVLEVSFPKPAAKPALPEARPPKQVRTMHDPPAPKPESPRADLLVLPGESLRLRPTDAGRVRVRCLNGPARCQLTVLPA